MTDGTLSVKFSPRLTPEQYAELTKLVEICTTKAQLRQAMEEAAAKWQRAVTFGD